MAAPSAPPIGIAVCRIPSARPSSVDGNQAMIARPLAALTLAPSAPTPTRTTVTPPNVCVVDATASMAACAGEPGGDHPALVDPVGDEPPGQEREEHPDPDRREHDSGLAERQPVLRLQRGAERRQADRGRGEARLRERPREHDPAIRADTSRTYTAGTVPAVRRLRWTRTLGHVGQYRTWPRVSASAPQLLRLADLVRVRAAVLGPGGLEHRRQPLQPRVGEEHAELLAELALEDVRVPVAVRAERGGGVVDVQRAQPVEADRGVDLVEAGVERGRVGHVDARHPEVARVEADAEPRMPVEPLPERRELVDRASDRAAGAGRVLHQQPRLVGAELEHLLHRRHDALEARLEAAAEVRADVEDDAVGADPARDLHRVAHRRDGLLVDGVVGRGEVAEVERVAEDAADPGLRPLLAEALEARRDRGSSAATCAGSA